MSATPKIWTVSALNRQLRLLLDQTFTPLWVTGEISNLNLHQPTGHVFLSLKDGSSLLRAVLFDGVPLARRLGLANGMVVEAYGRLRVYEAQGQYQIYLEQVRPGGLGQLQQQFEALKAKLKAEGLFETARKRPIPALPRRIGLITSVTGAALRDFLNIVNRRFPDIHIRIVDSRMQGAEAAPQIVQALRFLNDTRACDVIVLARGGGSMEDLWCFNDEALVRAVAASALPVISAIGHETDVTLADFVADLRAPTPSAAAELVVGRQLEWRERLTGLRQRLQNNLRLTFVQARQRLERGAGGLVAALADRFAAVERRVARAAGHVYLRQPELLLQPFRQRAAELAERLRLVSPARQLERHRERLAVLRARLSLAAGQTQMAHADRLTRVRLQLRALDPHAVLQRGYAILLKDGHPVKQAANVRRGDRLRGLLGTGEVNLEVTD